MSTLGIIIFALQTFGMGAFVGAYAVLNVGISLMKKYGVRFVRTTQPPAEASAA